MAVTYITSGESMAVPDESKRPLHSYHSAIEQRLDDGIELHGLTGRGKGIRRVVVSDELSDSEKSDLEDYLKTEVESLSVDNS